MDAPLRLGNYEPLLELAAGGMATVYVARQVGAGGFERIVVLKRVHRHLLANREFTDMFRDEAKVASLIRHPNVVAVSDVVEADKELFLVMDYIEGCSLATLRKAANERGLALEPRLVARMMADAMAGLHAAHEARDMMGQPMEVVHRDISPQNILLGVDGSSRLIDFGVAKARNRLSETRSGSVKGKYGYMSPEQAKGQPIDQRTDLFAMATVFHEMLTGRRLFKGENELDTILRITEAPMAPASSLNHLVSPALDAMIANGLARDPTERFQSAGEMMDALERACPPASAREAAALLAGVCGDRLKERSDAIRSMLEGRAAPLSVQAMSETGSAASSQGERSEGTEGKITVMQDTRAPLPRGMTAALVAAMAALVAVAVLVTFIVMRKPVPGAPPVHEQTAAVVPPPPPLSVATPTPPATRALVPDAAAPTKRPVKPVAPSTTRPELQSNPYGTP